MNKRELKRIAYDNAGTAVRRAADELSTIGNVDELTEAEDDQTREYMREIADGLFRRGRGGEAPKV